MHIFNEIIRGRLSTFEMHILDENCGIIASTAAEMPLHELHLSGNRLFLLYDDEMRVVPGTYAFLNIHLRGKSINSRRKAAGQLRRIHCFLTLTRRDVSSMDDALISELCEFLRGVGAITEKHSLKTQRCNNNVNEHLSTLRGYLSFLGIECAALNRARSVPSQTPYEGGSAPYVRTRYTNNLPGKVYCERGVPKYISPEEFHTLLKCAREAGDTAAELLMILMYAYGLRLGEALGLTLEDITEIPSGRTFMSALILRNRSSDRDYQHSKGKKTPLSAAEYKSRAYVDTKDVVTIDRTTHERLIDYVNETHARFMKERPSDYAKGSADVVSQHDAPESNHYVFLNRYGRPLSGQTWGNQLKYYFAQAGVPLQPGSERDNLSHRFRHGFAMLHAHFKPNPVGALELQKLLRHKSLSSTMVYYNPTAEDEARVKEAFQADLRKIIPELGTWDRG